MKTLMAIALTVCCWGIYGPVLHQGQHLMDGSRLRPFLCVGISYFFIAIVAAGIYLRVRGEKGHWTSGGILWSLISGAAGAFGALGIIMALTFGGAPIYVMPIVFGGAPVVNSFVTIVLAKTFKQISPLFYAGLIVVVAGAVTVMVFKPAPLSGGAHGKVEPQLFKIIASTMLTVISWGAYGAVLHKGQAKMGGSRLRPLICVGVSYLAIAVLVPVLILNTGLVSDHGAFSFGGVAWSLAGGCAGAFGALGIILAFTTGGKPVYVMPLVFSGAPVVNTFVTLITQKSAAPSPIFYAGLILVVLGAVVVLIFAPKGKPPAGAAETVELTTKTVIVD